MEPLTTSEFSELQDKFSRTSYEQKVELFSDHFSTGNMTTQSLSDKLKLINLVCYCTYRMKQQDPKMNAKEVLQAITGINLDDVFSNDKGNIQYAIYMRGLAIMCDDLLYNVVVVDSMGYTTSDDIVAEILRLINQWMPF